MFCQKILATITLLATFFSLSPYLIAGDTWNPIPPAAIPGSSATNTDFIFATVVTTYNSTDQTILATWLDINYIPTYAVWDGTTWTISATNIPGAAPLNSPSIPFYTTYDPAHNTIVATWADADNNPIYTIWNGSSWTTPTIIPGGSTSSYFSIYTTYDPANQTVLATWSDQMANPIYAVLTGYDWTTTAAIIPGSNYVSTNTLSAYNASNQTVFVSWVNQDTLPTYAIWNGSSWIVPGTLIPDGGILSNVHTVNPIYDASNGTIVVTWLEVVSSNSVPTYAVLNNTSWTVSATAIANDTVAEGMFFSTYDPANQTIMTTWLDETETTMYAIWNGSSWTNSAPIPNSVNNSFLLLNPVYNSSNQTIIATWLSLGIFTEESTFYPSYAVWNGSTWITPTTEIPGASPFVFNDFAPFLYETYDESNQTVLVTWIDSNGIPTYAVYSGTLLPASSFSGYATKTHYPFQTDLIYNLVWTPASDPSVTGYVLSRNGVPIFSVPASGPYTYADHNRNKKLTYTYTLVSQGQNGLESAPLTVTFN